MAKKSITDDQINRLHQRNLINNYTRDLALTTVLGLGVERRITRSKCARILKANPETAQERREDVAKSVARVLRSEGK